MLIYCLMKSFIIPSTEFTQIVWQPEFHFTTTICTRRMPCFVMEKVDVAIETLTQETSPAMNVK